MDSASTAINQNILQSNEPMQCDAMGSSQRRALQNTKRALINNYKHANEDVEKMILGNKCDMTDKRVVSKERGETIAREHNIRFMETSAKANINIERAFSELAEAILVKTAGRDDPVDRVTVDIRPTTTNKSCCN
uniref:Ras-related protein Rab-10-like n=1 Tax=Diabrotica virgifera virgifera TaxID=50390 RepID=A0A6P7FGC1_DIAVI